MPSRLQVLEKCKITDDDARQRLMNEIAILHRVQHPNLLHLLEAVEEVDAIYLVTEYVGGGELFAYIVQRGKIEEAEASRLFAQVTRTLTLTLPLTSNPNPNPNPASKL